MTSSDIQCGKIELDGLTSRGARRAPFSREVELLLAKGVVPNLYVFAGTNCWERADGRRVKHGLGTALVLPNDTDPTILRWPPVDSMVVCWPNSQRDEYSRKILLIQALIRDGVLFVAVEHAPRWISAWRKGLEPT